MSTGVCCSSHGTSSVLSSQDIPVVLVSDMMYVSWTGQVYMHLGMLIRAALKSVQLIMVKRGGTLLVFIFCFDFFTLLLLFFHSLYLSQCLYYNHNTIKGVSVHPFINDTPKGVNLNYSNFSIILTGFDSLKCILFTKFKQDILFFCKFSF